MSYPTPSGTQTDRWERKRHAQGLHKDFARLRCPECTPQPEMPVTKATVDGLSALIDRVAEERDDAVALLRRARGTVEAYGNTPLLAEIDAHLEGTKQDGE